MGSPFETRLFYNFRLISLSIRFTLAGLIRTTAFSPLTQPQKAMSRGVMDTPYRKIKVSVLLAAITSYHSQRVKVCHKTPCDNHFARTPPFLPLGLPVFHWPTSGRTVTPQLKVCVFTVCHTEKGTWQTRPPSQP
jgi:hypothetical protein